jgi:tRNA threonylcarbamoyladenosine biosynthesis protein TsaE
MPLRTDHHSHHSDHSHQSPDHWQGQWIDETDTAHFARHLATCPALTQATLALHGDLGAGKTTLVRHLLRALGVPGRIKSPTYAVVEPHTSRHCALLPPGEVLCIWHFDFYRFNDPREWEDAGFRELFGGPGLKLVEWPQRAGSLLPVIDLDIHLQAQDAPPATTAIPWDADEPAMPRQVCIQAHTATGLRLLQHLRT